MIKNLAHAALALMIVLGSGTGAALADKNWEELINWQTYAEAQPGKTSSTRKYFIYISSKKCGYCRMLEQKSLTDETIVDFIKKNYTAIHIDSDKERELAMRLGVNGVPDLRFLTPDGKAIARLPGYVPPQTLLNLLQYIQTDSYKTMALNDFVKKKKGN
jgi:thioredoxin-related protein